MIWFIIGIGILVVLFVLFLSAVKAADKADLLKDDLLIKHHDIDICDRIDRFNDDIRDINICYTCYYTFPECPAKNLAGIFHGSHTIVTCGYHISELSISSN